MVEFETKYTYERYKQYYWFSLFRGKYYRYGKVIFHFFTVPAVVIAIQNNPPPYSSVRKDKTTFV